ncbi:MAG: tetratricopeptide repeat protein [Dongiaceae bacterium]
MSHPNSHPTPRHRRLRTASTRAPDALRLAVALLIFVALALMFQAGTAFGAGGDSSDSPPSVADMIDDAEDHIDDEEYEDAIALLEKARAKEPNDPDILNWLGYSHRKLGDYDTSLEFYTAALAEDPEHLGANEYLGELYLLLDDLPMAEERLAVLAAACDSDCEEYEELLEEIEEYKEAHDQS